MDYGKSFTYMFEDEKWVTKFLIGVVVSIIPIVNFAGYGYVLQVLKNVRDGGEAPLPEWDDFGKFFMDGLTLVAGAFVYFLPVIVLAFLTLPMAMLAGETPGALFGLSITAVSCLMLVFTVIPSLMMPAVSVQYAKRDRFADMFAFSEIWDMIRADLGTYVIILLMLMIVLSFIGSIGFIACGIGAVFTGWYAYLTGGHIMGQYAGQQPGKEKIA